MIVHYVTLHDITLYGIALHCTALHLHLHVHVHLHYITLHLHCICITFTLHLHYIYITSTLHVHYIYITFTLHLHYIHITFTFTLHYIYITLHSRGLCKQTEFLVPVDLHSKGRALIRRTACIYVRRRLNNYTSSLTGRSMFHCSDSNRPALYFAMSNRSRLSKDAAPASAASRSPQPT